MIMENTNPLDNQTCWKVFVPYQLLSLPSSGLSGDINNQNSMVCVTSTGPLNRLGAVIGEWHSNTTTKVHQLSSGCLTVQEIWIDLQLEQGTIRCNLFEHSHKKIIKKMCLCILYDPTTLLASYILTSEVHTDSKANECVSLVIHCLLTEKTRQTEKLIWTEEQTSSTETSFIGCVYFVMRYLHWIFQVFGDRVESWLNGRHYWKMFLSVPAINGLLASRYLLLKNVSALDQQVPLHKMRARDVCMTQVIDSAMGVLLLGMMMYTGYADSCALFVMDWADDVVSRLKLLLNWLMGAPAGLKLNAQLARYLSHFFLYQLYLWTGYLSLLRPCLGTVLHYAMFIGVLGVSFQLCLVQDIVSMLTVHMYCFYVYAAKVYSLQVSALASLWRLFRGKKWNVLRGRVDSVTYDIDQLFIGTLLFTTLLFLLPTVALHYVVFVVLRLLLLSGQGLMSWCVSLITSAPVASIALWITRSRLVAGGVCFTILPAACDTKTIVLYMEVQQLPLPRLLRLCQTGQSQPNKTHTWKSLLSSIFTGNLIYPWVTPTAWGTKTA